ncbi:acetyltransferase [Paenibacillus xerothermodurans]|uniref:Pilin glycosylation protein n=1 Tax=Paenibacillus xerothermodurans TaxID=1977292 RepID=A0A2W1N9Y7_PAEXE|nr:acetyltransferase [Paenibacillus xerothermodurans]PZE20470.1 pilin glycosylation protein [Paenibacillus xerothermodurans]
MSKLLIIGAGGHGKVVADCAKESGRWDTIAFLDNKQPRPQRVLDWDVLDRLENAHYYLQEYPDVIVAIGDNALRLKLMETYKQMGFCLATVIHPSACVSRYAALGEGTVILPKAAVNAGAVLGAGCIINTGASVDHDGVIGKGVHISPGAHLAGNVRVGDLTWIGIGASVIQQVQIGANVIVGAGTVVIRSVTSNTTVVGIPGRAISRDEGKNGWI